MSTRRERAKAQSAQQSKQVVAAVSKQVKEHPIAKKMGDFFIDVAKTCNRWRYPCRIDEAGY